MTAKANGCVEIRTTTLAAIGVLITVLSLAAGAAAAWGALNSTVAQHHADKSIHLTSEDVLAAAPSRGEYNETLKRIDSSLTTINARLSRIEDRVYGR